MFSSYTKIQLFALLAAISSSVAYAGPVEASAFETRAGALTLPAIFKNATTQVEGLRQKLQRSIVFNTTINGDPQSVQSALTQINAVIGNTAAQINQIGKLPFDQISGGLSQSDIQYISIDFLNAVAVSVVAPQSIAAAYPEIQRNIDTVTASICPINWLCFFFPWLCWVWRPWIIFAAATFDKIGVQIAP
ncbi:hypothetical protein FRC04_000693 [Tulasnella sp. 424]|nr:hypothetical protein FRC04_000693 [Tulasnella sp. 424]KAG8967697.1 hypothetical protein FRC05_001955 [Tulasnella sp. 425]